jgi:hypothetical protein
MTFSLTPLTATLLDSLPSNHWYRFFAKIPPRRSMPDESVTLQIWVRSHPYLPSFFLFYPHRSRDP